MAAGLPVRRLRPADGPRRAEGCGGFSAAGRIVVAVGTVMVLGGCGLSGVGPPGGPAAGPAVTITQDVPASALLVVTTDPASGAALPGLLAATARPNEDLRIVQAGTPPRTIVAADSPGAGHDRHAGAAVGAGQRRRRPTSRRSTPRS